jgi:putative transposase
MGTSSGRSRSPTSTLNAAASAFLEIQQERGLPGQLRVDNGPEFIREKFAEWARAAGMHIHYIEPGEPNQNACIERFNRKYRDEVLDVCLFRSLAEVREATWWWRIDSLNRQKLYL